MRGLVRDPAFLSHRDGKTYESLFSLRSRFSRPGVEKRDSERLE